MWVNASVQRGAIGVAFRKVSRKIAAVVQKTALTRRLRSCLFLVRSGVRMLKANDGANTPAAPSLSVQRARSATPCKGATRSPRGSRKLRFLRRSPLFKVGRETGALETTLSTLAGFYVEHVVAAVKASPLLLNRA
jgi:type II secretory pathway component PulF